MPRSDPTVSRAKHILVTGGAGYIGSVTAQALIEVGNRVTVLDNLSRGHRELVPTEAAFIQADSDDADVIARVADDGLDAVVHLAAFIEVGESVLQPEIYLENNAHRTIRLLDLLMNHGVERFVFSSTAAVYGVPIHLPIPVGHRRRPVNAYGQSKMLVEEALAERRPRLRSAVLRYFNAAGATGGRGEAHVHESHLIPRVLDVALGEREAIGVYGTDWPTRDGTCVRDYIHVSDLVEAHVLALDVLDDRDEVVCNVGTGRGSTVKEVIEACRSATGHPIPVNEQSRRPGDVAELVADPSSARDLLGWEPRIPDIASIVESAWEWHQRRVRA